MSRPAVRAPSVRDLREAVEVARGRLREAGDAARVFDRKARPGAPVRAHRLAAEALAAERAAARRLWEAEDRLLGASGFGGIDARDARAVEAAS